MATIKVSEAAGTVLDWAVAKCEGLDWYQPEYGEAQAAYSTDWSQGGPIIERKKISTCWEGEVWVATLFDTRCDWHGHRYGPTPLIAAMRCFVASKLGDTVEVPDKLI